jgi:transcriptional regulator with XRE-family HTH domain
MPPVRRLKSTRRRTFLKEWREYRSLTQEQAAERIGVTQATLSRVERGVTPYDQDLLERIAFAYLCEPADLLMRNPLDRDAVWSITDNLRKADPVELERAAAMIDLLLKRQGGQ